jgi:hypothetical protein
MLGGAHNAMLFSALVSKVNYKTSNLTDIFVAFHPISRQIQGCCFK